jgi:hypothetical protein
MKQTILKNCLFALTSIVAISCSNSIQLGEDGDKVIQILSKGQFYRVEGDNGQEFSEVKLVREITAGDSLNFLLSNETVKHIIEEHDRMATNIQYQITKEADPSYAYNGSSSVEERIDEINQFADAWNGTFSEKFYFKLYYQQIFRLKNLPKDKVIAKIYSVKHKRKIDDKDWSVDYWVMSPDLSTCFSKIDVEQTKLIPKSKNDIEKIHFDYVIDERNFISSGVD